MTTRHDLLMEELCHRRSAVTCVFDYLLAVNVCTVAKQTGRGAMSRVSVSSPADTGTVTFSVNPLRRNIAAKAAMLALNAAW